MMQRMRVETPALAPLVYTASDRGAAVDRDRAPAVGTRLALDSLPTWLDIVQGREAKRMSGAGSVLSRSAWVARQ